MHENTPITLKQVMVITYFKPNFQKLLIELEDKASRQETKINEMQSQIENHVISTNIKLMMRTKEDKKQQARKTLYTELLSNKQLEDVLITKSKEILDHFVQNTEFQLKFLK